MLSESNLEECLQNRRKTTNGFVFSKIELTKEEVLEHYKRKTRKTKYKFLLIDKETGAKTLYNTLDDMAKTLQVKPAVLRNIINGANSKLNRMYKFERILNAFIVLLEFADIFLFEGVDAFTLNVLCFSLFRRLQQFYILIIVLRTELHMKTYLIIFYLYIFLYLT